MNVTRTKPGKKMKVGLIGAGSIVQQVHLPVLKAIDEVAIEWICDKAALQAKATARNFGLPACYERIEECPQVDIALIATPVGLREPILDTCFQRRWNIFCEKPPATDLEQFDRYLERASSVGVQFGVGLMRRYYEGTVAAARLMKSGCFGAPLEVWAGEGGRMRGTGRDALWYLGDKQASGGGILIETGSHLVDQVFQILDATAFTLSECHEVTFGGIDYETIARAAVRTTAHREVPVTFKLSMTNDVFNGVIVKFEHATVFLQAASMSAMPQIQAADGSTVATIGVDDYEVPGPYGPFYLEWMDFIRQCQTGGASRVTATSARLSVSFIDHCYARVRARSPTEYGGASISGGAAAPAR